MSKGDAPGAAKLLDGISRGGAVPGVTDEALFRLALLSLRQLFELMDHTKVL